MLSLALQFGAPLAVLRNAVTRELDGRPSGPIGAILDAITGETLMKETIWSDGKAALMLVTLIGEGYSCGIIARKLCATFNVRFTRSAVISKKTRMKIKSPKPLHELTPSSVIPSGKPKSEKRVMLKTVVSFPALRTTPLAENIATAPVPLPEISDDRCHWIVKDPNIMCNDPVMPKARQPYCSYHIALGHRPLNGSSY